MATRQWITNFIEQEGLAKLTILLLVVTCAGCLSYTWGYYEGVHNTLYKVEVPASNSSSMGAGTASHSHVVQVTVSKHHRTAGKSHVLPSKAAAASQPDASGAAESSSPDSTASVPGDEKDQTSRMDPINGSGDEGSSSSTGSSSSEAAGDQGAAADTSDDDLVDPTQQPRHLRKLLHAVSSAA